MASSVKKITLSLPIELVEQTTYLASRFGVSRSALFGELLAQPVSVMFDIISEIPAEMTPEESIRYASTASESLQQVFEDLKNATQDLFGGAAE